MPPAAWGLWPGPSVALVAGRFWGIGWLTSVCASKVSGGPPKLVPKMVPKVVPKVVPKMMNN